MPPLRFDELRKRPLSYADARSVRSPTLGGANIERIWTFGQRFTASSEWFHPNQGDRPCTLHFDIIEDDAFGAFAWSTGSQHWIVFHSGALVLLGRFFVALFDADEFRRALHLERATGQTITSLREAAYRMALESILRHEFVHVVLGHTGHLAAKSPLGVVADAPAAGAPVWSNEENVVLEQAADYFALSALSNACSGKVFAMLDADEVPPDDDPRQRTYLAFLGSMTTLAFFAAAGLDNPASYPSLSARLTTLFRAFLEEAAQRGAEGDGLDRLLTTVQRDLQAGCRALTTPGLEAATALLDEMDSDPATDRALDELRRIEERRAQYLAAWAVHCVSARTLGGPAHAQSTMPG